MNIETQRTAKGGKDMKTCHFHKQKNVSNLLACRNGGGPSHNLKDS